MGRNSWTDTAIWIILFILLVPSGLVVASWNSLPGQHLYQVKIIMEKALLAIAPTNQAKGELQVAYTERRFSEANRLLEDASNPAGLEAFRQQVEEAKLAIAAAPPGPARTQLAQRYVASLQSASMQLEQQKQIIRSRQPSTVSQSPATQQVVVVNQVVVVQQIVQTQTVINTVINNVQATQNEVLPTPTPTLVPTFTPIPTPEPTATPVPTPVPPQDSNMSSFNADVPKSLPTDTPTPTPTPPGNSDHSGNNNNNP